MSFYEVFFLALFKSAIFDLGFLLQFCFLRLLMMGFGKSATFFSGIHPSWKPFGSGCGDSC